MSDTTFHESPSSRWKNILILAIPASLTIAGGLTLYFTAIHRRAAISTYQQLIILHDATKPYAVDCGRPPDTLDALVANPGVPHWQGPYLDPPVIPLDAWQHPLRYRIVEGVPRIDSAGPDGAFDTPDDITTPGPPP